MKRQRILGISTALLTFTVSPLAMAGEPAADDAADGADEAPADEGASAEAGGGFSLSTGGGASADGDASAKRGNKGDKSDKWIHRYPPERGYGEVGIYGGIFIPSSNHELYDDSLFAPDFDARHDYRALNADIGLRGSYFFLKFLGVEGEFSVMPVGMDGGGNGLAYSARAHAIAQLARWSVVPFAVAGAGMLGVSSDDDTSELGSDIDFGLHFGVGAKIFITNNFLVRLDIRDIVSNKFGADDPFGANHLEVLLGLSYAFGKDKKEPAPVEEPKDSDGDGIMDPDDKCVDVPGVAEYDGCPIPDTDGDGILDPDDKCVDEPENKNGYEDADGCPDEIPKEVEAFTGVIEGIYFDTNKDTIKATSEKILKKALKVLKDFPDLRVKISGHTDSRGDHDYNMDLSDRRAKSVRKWFEDHGLDSSRFETQGYGPDSPIDTNDTKAGRAKNRRIEFSLIQ